MKKLKSEIVHFLRDLGCGIVSTVDRSGCVHSACKGIVEVDPAGRVYLFDLYRGRTYRNIKRDPHLSITGVDDHDFSGYCLKGTAKILERHMVAPHTMKAWEEVIARRLTRRIVRNLKDKSEHPGLPESQVRPGGLHPGIADSQVRPGGLHPGIADSQVRPGGLHPEALLPDPQHLIVLEVDEIVDLIPVHMRSGGKADG